MHKINLLIDNKVFKIRIYSVAIENTRNLWNSSIWGTEWKIQFDISSFIRACTIQVFWNQHAQYQYQHASRKHRGGPFQFRKKRRVGSMNCPGYFLMFTSSMETVFPGNVFLDIRSLRITSCGQPQRTQGLRMLSGVISILWMKRGGCFSGKWTKFEQTVLHWVRPGHTFYIFFLSLKHLHPVR